MMRIVILGPPGSGKGTQGRKLASYLGVPHIATGDILREMVKKKTELGERAKKYMEKGELVPDEIVIEMIKQRIGKEGFVLDGFPRTLPQAVALEKIGVNLVILIELPLEEIIRRLSSRRVCERCGRNYNLIFNPPQTCDCGGKLILRSDDNPSTIKRRYEIYQKEMSPIIEFYGKKVLEINGAQLIEEVFSDIISKMKHDQGEIRVGG
jgi:adenylate kinase